jgi:hypothetical protein
MRDENTLPIDTVFAPFEARPVTTSEAEAAERREGFKFGWELNRLQGGVRTPVNERLEDLMVFGKIDKAEYLLLAVELVKQGYLGASEPATNG